MDLRHPPHPFTISLIFSFQEFIPLIQKGNPKKVFHVQMHDHLVDMHRIDDTHRACSLEGSWTILHVEYPCSFRDSKASIPTIQLYDRSTLGHSPCLTVVYSNIGTFAVSDRSLLQWQSLTLFGPITIRVISTFSFVRMSQRSSLKLAKLPSPCSEVFMSTFPTESYTPGCLLVRDHSVLHPPPLSLTSRY